MLVVRRIQRKPRKTATLHLVPDRVAVAAEEVMAALLEDIESAKGHAGNRIAGYALICWTADGTGGVSFQNKPTSPFPPDLLPAYCAEKVRGLIRDIKINEAIGKPAPRD